MLSAGLPLKMIQKNVRIKKKSKQWDWISRLASLQRLFFSTALEIPESGGNRRTDGEGNSNTFSPLTSLRWARAIREGVDYYNRTDRLVGKAAITFKWLGSKKIVSAEELETQLADAQPSIIDCLEGTSIRK